MARTLLIAPAGVTGTVSTPSGREEIDANGFVTVDAEHVLSLLNAGYRLAPTSASVPIGANGLVETALPLVSARTVAGIPLAASAAASTLGYSSTPGTGLTLVGVAAQNNTKTDAAIFEAVLPHTYVAGEDVEVVIHAGFSGSGTAGTKTVDASAYAVDSAGAHSADLVGTAAQTIASTAADYTFVIDGEDLVPGSRLVIKITTALQETGNSATVTAAIGSVRIK